MNAFEHVKEAIPQDDYKILVTFNGGKRAVFDCSHYLADPFWAVLKDESFFRRVSLDHGVLTWPNGVDIAPEEVWADSFRV